MIKHSRVLWTSLGREYFFWFLGLGISMGGLLSCATSAERNSLSDREVRILEDRSNLEKLRENIPLEKRMENDEKAFDLNLLSNPKRNPEEIRSIFDREMRRKRERFQKAIEQERKEFSRAEKNQRQEFLRNLEKERKAFSKSRSSSEERSDFNREQSEKRSDFFARERERRADFESEIRVRRKDFDDQMRSRQSGFYQELRAFSQRAKKQKNNLPTNEDLDLILKNNPGQEELKVE